MARAPSGWKVIVVPDLFDWLKRMQRETIDADREADWVRTAHGAAGRAHVEAKLQDPDLSPRKRKLLNAVLRRL